MLWLDIIQFGSITSDVSTGIGVAQRRDFEAEENGKAQKRYGDFSFTNAFLASMYTNSYAEIRQSSHTRYLDLRVMKTPIPTGARKSAQIPALKSTFVRRERAYFPVVGVGVVVVHTNMIPPNKGILGVYRR